MRRMRKNEKGNAPPHYPSALEVLVELLPLGSNTNGSSVKISTKRFLSKIPNFLGLANS